MKVTHKYGIGSFSGTIDLGVFRPSKSGLTSIMRRWVYPKLTQQNETLGTVSGNLKAVWSAASTGFKTDWQTYCARYNSENPPTNGFDAGWTSFGAFTKMMYAWQASDPSHVELTAISPEDMATVGAVVNSVENCIDLGLVPTVSNYTDLSTTY